LQFATAFSSNYDVARQRFREAAACLGWSLESHAISVRGPNEEELTTDIACSPDADPSRVLVISSGLHGIEGFLGSAVQLKLLQRWSETSNPPLKCVFVHALNPFGFAWLRRCDEFNIDLNRNFLLDDESYEGTPTGYRQLNDLLNPQQPPSRWGFFTLRALGAVARHGMPVLRQAIAAGQYDFPKGLFYGGVEPAPTHHWLKKNLQRLLEGSRQTVHLDFHTGLGRRGDCRLLIDYQLDAEQVAQLNQWFGSSSFDARGSRQISYETRGGLGSWCVAQFPNIHYLFAYAEFGTYHPIKTLAALRAENQAYHWGRPADRSTIRAKQRLKEIFCPSSAAWRERVLRRSIELVDNAVRGLTQGTAVYRQ
jgi:hypothetical protein